METRPTRFLIIAAVKSRYNVVFEIVEGIGTVKRLCRSARHLDRILLDVDMKELFPDIEK